MQRKLNGMGMDDLSILESFKITLINYTKPKVILLALTYLLITTLFIYNHNSIDTDKIKIGKNIIKLAKKNPAYKEKIILCFPELKDKISGKLATTLKEQIRLKNSLIEIANQVEKKCPDFFANQKLENKFSKKLDKKNKPDLNKSSNG